MKTLLNSLVISLVTYFWSSIYWMNPKNSWLWEQYLKPWVQRPLVPWIINVLERAGIPESIATVSVVVALGVSLYLALLTLIRATDNTVSEWKVMLAVVAGLFAFQVCRTPYDLMTALLWTVALIFIVKQNHMGYVLLFPLVCLNRIETAPLLILLYWLRFPKGKWIIILSQGVTFVVSHYLLKVLFADIAGSAMWIEPLENLGKFWQSPLRTILHLSVTAVILFHVVRRADYQSLYFQRAFVILAPLFVILYVIFGQAFELRVFWELFPVLSVLILL